MNDEAYLDCQAPVAEQTGAQSFCLAPETAYRVRFDGVVPYLPGPMQLGFKVAGVETSAPIPANWISTCSLDATTGSCDEEAFDFRWPPHSNRFDFRDHLRDRLRDRRPDVDEIRSRGKSGQPFFTLLDDPGAGTAGAQLCKGAGNSITCIWTANGTWELPSLYTEPGGWVVVQALGGAGGAGNPAASNPGGAAGQAQAVVPTESLAGKTLNIFVGESGADGIPENPETETLGTPGSGGAASMVTANSLPSSFVSNHCTGTPEGLDALVIAAAGGGGGNVTSGDGGTISGGPGGIAIGGSGVQNMIGSGVPGEQVELSYGGQAPTYGSNPL